MDETVRRPPCNRELDLKCSEQRTDSKAVGGTLLEVNPFLNGTS